MKWVTNVFKEQTYYTLDRYEFGEPVPTGTYSAEQLMEMGLFGVYEREEMDPMSDLVEEMCSK